MSFRLFLYQILNLDHIVLKFSLYYLCRSPPKFPDIVIPEDLVVSIALSVRHEVNRASTTFKEVASGKDLKKFLKVI